MPLRPPEFKVSSDKPFESDTLDRKRRVKAMCSLIRNELNQSSDSSAIVSVEGGFGTGKSVFLKMCAAHLRQEEESVSVIEFNAWQQSHTKNALVDLVSALTEDQSFDTGKLKEVALKVAGSTLGQLVKISTAGIVDLTEIIQAVSNDSSGDPFAAWSDIEDNVKELKETLGKLVSSNDSRLVILIDELDRCLPSYAMELLNTARHLFDVPGIVIILGINRAELEYRVQKVYGQSCDASTYLRRFVDLSVSLGGPPAERVSGYLTGVFDDVNLDPENDTTTNELKEALAFRIQHSNDNASLRDIEQMVHHVDQIFSLIEEKPETTSDTTYSAIIALLILRQINRNVYDNYRADQCDAFEAVKAFRGGLNQKQLIKNTQENASFLYWYRLEKVLFWLGTDFGFHNEMSPADKKEDFKHQFVDAGLGDSSDASRYYDDLEHFPLLLPRNTGYMLRKIGNLIELVN